MGFHSPMNPQYRWYVVAPGWVLLLAGLDGALDYMNIGTGHNAEGKVVAADVLHNDDEIKVAEVFREMFNLKASNPLYKGINYAGKDLFVVSIPVGAYMTGIYR